MSSLSDFLGGGGGSTGNKTAVTLEAAENITAGNAVCIRSDGKAEKTNSIYPDGLAYSDLVTSIDEKTSQQTSVAMNTDGTVMVGLSHNSSTCEVQVFDRNTTTGELTPRSENPLLPDLEGNNVMLGGAYRIEYCADQDVFIVFYVCRSSTNTSGQHALVAIDVPTTGAPTIGTPVTVTGLGAGISDNNLHYLGGLAIDPDSNRIWVVLNTLADQYGYYIGFFQSYTVSGTTITNRSSTNIRTFTSTPAPWVDTGLLYVGNDTVWAFCRDTYFTREYADKITVDSTTGAYSSKTFYNGLNAHSSSGAYAYDSTNDKIIHINNLIGNYQSSGTWFVVFSPDGSDFYSRTAYKIYPYSPGTVTWAKADPTNGHVYFMVSGGDIRAITDVGTGTISGLPSPYGISYSTTIIADTESVNTTEFAVGGEGIVGANFSMISWVKPDGDTGIQAVVFNQDDPTNWYDFIGVAAEDINSGSTGEIIVNGGVATISTTLDDGLVAAVYPFKNGAFTQSSDRNVGGSYGIGQNLGKTAIIIRDEITND